MCAEARLLSFPVGWQVNLTSDRHNAKQSVQDVKLELYSINRSVTPYELSKVQSDITLGLGGNQTVTNQSASDQVLIASFHYKDTQGDMMPSHSADLRYEPSKMVYDVQDYGGGYSFQLRLQSQIEASNPSADARLVVLPARWKLRLTCDRYNAAQAVQEAHVSVYAVDRSTTPYKLLKVQDIVLGLGANQTLKNSTFADQLLMISFHYKDTAGQLQNSTYARPSFGASAKQAYEAEDYGQGASFWLWADRVL